MGCGRKRLGTVSERLVKEGVRLLCPLRVEKKFSCWFYALSYIFMVKVTAKDDY